MIRRRDIIKVRGEAGVTTQRSHVVKITISGRQDLEAFARIAEQKGNTVFAARIRSAKRFTVTLPPQEANAIWGRAS